MHIVNAFYSDASHDVTSGWVGVPTSEGASERRMERSPRLEVGGASLPAQGLDAGGGLDADARGGLPPPVNILSVPYEHDFYNRRFVVNNINNPVIPFAQPVAVGRIP